MKKRSGWPKNNGNLLVQMVQFHLCIGRTVNCILESLQYRPLSSNYVGILSRGSQIDASTYSILSNPV